MESIIKHLLVLFQCYYQPQTYSDVFDILVDIAPKKYSHFN